MLRFHHLSLLGPADILRDLVAVGPNTATPRSLTNNSRVLTQTAFGKGLPDQTSILTASQDLVGLKDCITGIEERWPAGLKLHAVNDQLKG